MALIDIRSCEGQAAGGLGNEHCDLLENQNSLSPLKPFLRDRNGIKEKSLG